MKRTFILFVFSFFCLVDIQAQNRGDLLNYELIADKTPGEIDDLLSGSTGIPSIFLGFLIPTTFDVQVYKLTYSTTDGNGNKTIATGAAYIPKPYPCDAPLAAYLHGTIIDEASVPSNLVGVEGTIGWAMATDGYVAALPDYIGLGDSPGAHPYVHSATEASASIDMMRATRHLCSILGAGLNGQVFISGYSQGGHSTLATQREIERNHRSEFNLQFVAAGAGPYDLSGTQKDFAFNNDFYPNPSFLPYVLEGYERIYGNIYNTRSDIYVAPYDEQIPILLDGSLSVEEIDALLPANWKSIFQPDYLNGVENDYYNPVNVALRKNNLYAWSPRTTTRLYYCTSDEQVDPANSVVAWWNFFLRGAGWRTAAVPLGPFMHRDCAPIALLVGKAKFDGYRNDRNCNRNARKVITDLTVDNEQLKPLVNEVDIPDLATQLRNVGRADLAAIVDQEDISTQLKLYPNPASSVTTLDFSGLNEEVREVKISDTSGKLIRAMPVAGQPGKLTLDIQDLPAGMYIITVEASEQYYLNLIKD